MIGCVFLMNCQRSFATIYKFRRLRNAIGNCKCWIWSSAKACQSFSSRKVLQKIQFRHSRKTCRDNQPTLHPPWVMSISTGDRYPTDTSTACVVSPFALYVVGRPRKTPFPALSAKSIRSELHLDSWSPGSMRRWPVPYRRRDLLDAHLFCTMSHRIPFY